MTFVPVKTCYVNKDGERSTSYASMVERLPNPLSMRATYTADRFDTRTETLFHGVDVLLPRYLSNPDWRATCLAKHATGEGTLTHLLSNLRERLIQIVIENWSSDKTHVVLHSSGLDSRMLSWAILQARERLGDDWLGDIIFLCSKWEGSEFKRIMEYEGWNRDQYHVIRENAKLQEYYKPSLTDFSGAWERADGCSAIPVNLFWYLPWLAKRDGIISDPVQLWTSQFGNTMLDTASDKLGGEAIRRIFKRNYFSIFGKRPMYGEQIIHPFTDCELLRIVSSSEIVLKEKLRPMLLKSMDERLASFTNLNSDGDRHRRIANYIIEKMVSDYDKSWYGKRVRPNARPQHKTTEFQPFWSYWTTASFCQHLINSGKRIILYG